MNKNNCKISYSKNNQNNLKQKNIDIPTCINRCMNSCNSPAIADASGCLPSCSFRCLYIVGSQFNYTNK